MSVTLEVVLGVALGLSSAATGAAVRSTRARGRAVAERAQDLRRLWSLTGDGVAELTLDGRVVRASQEFAALLSVAPASLRDRRLADLAHPSDCDPLVAILNPLAAGDAVRTADLRLRHASGAWHLVRLRASVGTDSIVIAAREPGEPGERERSADAFDRVFTTSPFGMAEVGADGTVRRANGALAEMLGRELTDVHLDELVSAGDLAEQRHQLARLVAGELHAVTLRLHLRAADGRPAPARVAVCLLRDDAGEPVSYLVQVEDASERERLAERVRFEAEHDPLTGLLNRHAFADLLAHETSQARRHQRDGALIVLDLAGLHELNGTYGTDGGDVALEAVAADLRSRLRVTDAIARLGSGEFAVILAGVDAAGARTIADGLTGRREIEIAGAAVRLELRAGIARFGAEHVTAEQLFVQADAALAEARERRGDVVVYDERMRFRNSARRSWAEKLRTGLETDAFVLDAQPIVDAATGEHMQYELLLRLRDDDGAIVRPATFLHIAERYGLMRAIDEWVVLRGIAFARERIAQGAPITLAINVSADSIGDQDFLDLVVRQLLDAPDVGQHLVFELTERTAVADLDQARLVMARLSEFGCRFALDDFGTGAGSLSYLKQLPVDYLKLDGEFTRGLPTSAADAEIVAAVVTAAHGLGKQVVAECVEDDAILAAVRGFGVELAQGLHVGRPARATDLLAVTA